MILSISFTLCGMGQMPFFLLFSILFIINRIIWIAGLIWCWFDCFLIRNFIFLCFTFAFTFLFFNLQFSLNKFWYLLFLIGDLLISCFILFFNHLFYLWLSKLSILTILHSDIIFTFIRLFEAVNVHCFSVFSIDILLFDIISIVVIYWNILTIVCYLCEILIRWRLLCCCACHFLNKHTKRGK